MQAQLTNQIEYCTGCKSPLSLPLPTINSPVELVQCGACDHHYYADGSADLPANILRGEQAALEFSPCKHLSFQSHGAFREWLATQESHSRDNEQQGQRRQQRVLASLPLVVTPLNCQYLPLSNAFEATSMNISASGVAFEVQCDANAFFWMMDFSNSGLTGIQSVVKMVRMEPLGGSSWKVSGPFFSQRYEQYASFQSYTSL